MIPTLHNCSHSPDGWCLACVKKYTQDTEETLKMIIVAHVKEKAILESRVTYYKNFLESITFIEDASTKDIKQLAQKHINDELCEH